MCDVIKKNTTANNVFLKKMIIRYDENQGGTFLNILFAVWSTLVLCHRIINELNEE